MDYLLRDAYFTGVNVLSTSRVILRVIRPYKAALLTYSGMHAVEDYTSRYQMYMQVYFHPVSRDGKSC